MPPKKHRTIHLRFRDHSADSPYLKPGRPIAKGTRSFLFEYTGRNLELESWQIGNKIPRSHPQYSKMKATKERTLHRLKRRGGIPIEGMTQNEKRAMEALGSTASIARNKMQKTPTLKNMKDYFRAEADWHIHRHKLARKAIRELAEQDHAPIEGQFGTLHSLLAKELREEGYDVSYEIPEKIHWLDTQTVRKLMLGKKPTSLDYKRGYVCMLDYYNSKMVKTITGKAFGDVTNADWRFYSSLQNSLVRKLSEEQLDRIIKNKSPRMLFALNGLSSQPTRKQLKQWLEKNSWHYRRVKSHERTRRKRRIERATGIDAVKRAARKIKRGKRKD